MVFKRSAASIACCGVLLLGCGAGAGLCAASPRLATLWLIAVLPLLIWLSRAARGGGAPPLETEPPAQPARQSAQAMQEIRLEHAPLALFRLSGEQAEPLNARARRLVAPGYASEPEALYRQLLRQQDERQWIRFDTERGVERALAASSSLIIDGRQEKLLALLPLESELEAETLRAWQQLVHVLTHEIMNSLTPVASLSRSAGALLAEASASIPAELGQELDIAFAAISRRADSLADFVGSYRSLSALPEPKPEVVALSGLFERLQALVAPGWRERGGEASFRVEPATLEVRVDAGQLEQALINLIKNAFEATAGQPRARLEVIASPGRGGRLRLEVCDNGPGVAEDRIEQIFTPFYSTKAKGRGIGLALVRQLVNGNGGTVRYARNLGGGARLILTF
ncbi:sensor histidine kinase [Chromobacterium vaccinii]|uniref:sensor histidine kinase n=1 Tax=Chromobacterium vaccinii TaxID=1108595 RepID=UPI003C790772